MYRLILISVLLFVLNTCEGGHKNRHRHPHSCQDIDKFSKDVSRDISRVGETIKNFCKAQSEIEVKEFYSQEVYKLTVKIQNVTEDDLEIKTRDRVLSVKHDDVAVVKILPDIVSPVNATYDIDEELVHVKFQYRIEFGTEMNIDCNADSHNEYSGTHKIRKAPKEEKIDGQEIKGNVVLLSNN